MLWMMLYIVHSLVNVVYLRGVLCSSEENLCSSGALYSSEEHKSIDGNIAAYESCAHKAQRKCFDRQSEI